MVLVMSTDDGLGLVSLELLDENSVHVLLFLVKQELFGWCARCIISVKHISNTLGVCLGSDIPVPVVPLLVILEFREQSGVTLDTFVPFTMWIGSRGGRTGRLWSSTWTGIVPEGPTVTEGVKFVNRNGLPGIMVDW